MSTIVKTFQPRFVDLVDSGKKLCTIRPTPKRIPKVGDTIFLRAWTGLPYRSKQRRLGEGEITCVSNITLVDRKPTLLDEDLARMDGFSSWNEMRDWFKSTHGLPFEGILIQWRKTK